MKYGIKIIQKEVCGESVNIKTLSGGANAARIIELMGQAEKNPAVLAELARIVACECLVDESGNPEFKTPEEAGNSCSLGFIKDFMIEALDASGLTEDAGEVRKNLQAVQ